MKENKHRVDPDLLPPSRYGHQEIKAKSIRNAYNPMARFGGARVRFGTAKNGCSLCDGDGIAGRDATTGIPVKCLCVERRDKRVGARKKREELKRKKEKENG